MKKEISILLLFCFSFYHFGYYLIYFSYKYKIEIDWIATIHADNQDFEKEQLIKIPLNIPYMADQEDFQGTNASFEKNGETYRVVKQRYVSDTLQIVYVPDVALNMLDRTIKKWVVALNDGVNKENSNGKIIPKFFLKDYLQPLVSMDFKPMLFQQQKTCVFIFLPYVNITIDHSDPPPEMA